MATRIDGKAVAAKIHAQGAQDVEALKARGICPGMAVVLVGDDPASKIYVNNKKKACAETGIYSEEHLLPAETTQEELLALIEKLNELGGANGIGIVDMVENRLVGMKSRGVYETPGGTILYAAHELLEMLCLDKDTQHFKQHLAIKFAELVYNGQWFTPLREALSAFVDKTQENVSGEVKLKVYKGNIINAGIKSEHSLYSEEIATFGEEDVYNQHDAEGFINLFGLPIKVKAMLDAKKLK